MADLVNVVKNSIEKQFNCTNISALVELKAEVYNKYFGNVAEKFSEEVLNFNTCSSSALDYFWGQIFKINRKFKDENGNLMVLTDAQFREIIKIRAFGTTWDGSIASINLFLSNLFKDRGVCYMLDPQNMTYQLFIFNFELEPWERYLFSNYDILPRPAGVGTLFEEVGDDKWFGFFSYQQLYSYPTTIGFSKYDNKLDGKTITYAEDINDL